MLIPDAGIVNYPEIAAKHVEIIQARGGVFAFNQAVNAINETDETVTNNHHVHNTIYPIAKWLINCAGLFSDRVAKMAGYDTGMKIVPFVANILCSTQIKII